MFKNPFSFNGRIRRLEYGLSQILFFLIFFAAILLTQLFGVASRATIIPLVSLVTFWLMLAQGAKRCHDRGNPGWWQLIPFYGIWMTFADGEIGENEYGKNPKGVEHEFDAVYSNGEKVKPIDDVDEDGVIKG